VAQIFKPGNFPELSGHELLNNPVIVGFYPEKMGPVKILPEQDIEDESQDGDEDEKGQPGKCNLRGLPFKKDDADGKTDIRMTTARRRMSTGIVSDFVGACYQSSLSIATCKLQKTIFFFRFIESLSENNGYPENIPGKRNKPDQ